MYFAQLLQNGISIQGMDPSSKEGGVRLAQVQAQARKMLTGGCSALRHEKAETLPVSEGFHGRFGSQTGPQWPLCVMSYKLHAAQRL